MAPRDLCSPRSDATKSPQSVVQSPRGEQRRLEEVNAAYSVKLQQLRQAERQGLHKTKELEAELATVQNQLVEANAARSALERDHNSKIELLADTRQRANLSDRERAELVAQELSLRNTEGSLQREVTRLRGQVRPLPSAIPRQK